MSSAALLAVTADPSTAQVLQRLTAAAGIDLLLLDDARDLSTHPTVRLVLVGADLAADLARLGPPGRAAVHLVGPASMPDGVFRSAMALGASSVLALPEDSARLVELLTGLDGSLPDCRAVAVTGGSGGVGVSVLAAALALRAADQGPTVLVDLDEQGPGPGLLLGGEPAPAGVTWGELTGSSGRLGAGALREALPVQSGVGLLTWPEARIDPRIDPRVDPSPALVREVVSAARRGNDCVVVDLPRRHSAREESALAQCDLLVVVVAANVSSVAAARHALGSWQATGIRTGLVVRRPTAAASGADVAGVLGLPLLAELPDARRLAESLDIGLGPLAGRRNPIGASADRILAELREGS